MTRGYYEIHLLFLITFSVFSREFLEIAPRRCDPLGDTSELSLQPSPIQAQAAAKSSSVSPP